MVGKVTHPWIRIHPRSRLVWCRLPPSPMRFWCHSTARGRTIILLAGPQKTPALSEGITLAVSPNLVPLRFLRSESAPESRNIVLPRASLSPPPNSSAKSPKTAAGPASHASLFLLLPAMSFSFLYFLHIRPSPYSVPH